MPDLALQFDVDVDAERWASIAERTREYHDRLGYDPRSAYVEAIHDHLTAIPNIAVEGEVKGPENIDGVPLPEVDEADD